MSESKKAKPAATPKGAKKAAAEKKPRGNPGQYDLKVKPYLEDIARYVSHGVTEGQVCEFYRVGKTQWAQYKKGNSELTETLYRARVEGKTRLINRSHEAATGYDYTETTIVKYFDKEGQLTGSKETTVTKHAKADGSLLQFLLINRYPGEFSRDPQVIEIRRELLEIQKKLAALKGDGDDMGSV
jgi:hypothetical protein